MKDVKIFENDIALSSRIRLARNLDDKKFPNVTSKAEAENIKNEICNVLLNNDEALFADLQYIDLSVLTDSARVELIEKHLISPNLGANEGAAVLLSEQQGISLMINEEDHLRIQYILDGFNLFNAYELADNADNWLQNQLHFAFDSRWGYLTSCPTNVGTGMRASVMLHIPAIAMSGEILLIQKTAAKFGLTIRGTYGEGSELMGDLIQISNQNSLGMTEENIINDIHAVSKEIIKKERRHRNALLENNEDEIRDHIMRAFGILSYAHSIDTQESMRLLSLIRMGIDMGLVDMELKTVNLLMRTMQPATIKGLFPEMTDKIDIARAQYIRKKLNHK